MFNLLDLLAHKLFSSAAPVMYSSFGFLKRGTPRNLVLAPGASIRINMVHAHTRKYTHHEHTRTYSDAHAYVYTVNPYMYT